jgi:hypothetical protein
VMSRNILAIDTGPPHVKDVLRVTLAHAAGIGAIRCRVRVPQAHPHRGSHCVHLATLVATIEVIHGQGVMGSTASEGDDE